MRINDLIGSTVILKDCHDEMETIGRLVKQDGYYTITGKNHEDDWVFDHSDFQEIRKDTFNPIVYLCYG